MLHDTDDLGESPMLREAERRLQLLLKRAGFRQQDIKDMIQTVLLKFFMQKEKTKKALKPGEWLRYICRIGLNEANDQRRKEATWRYVPLEAIAHPATARQPQHDAYERAEQLARLERVLERLEPNERHLWSLMTIHSGSALDIAAALGISYDAARQRCHGLRCKVKALLEEDGRSAANGRTGQGSRRQE